MHSLLGHPMLSSLRDQHAKKPVVGGNSTWAGKRGTHYSRVRESSQCMLHRNEQQYSKAGLQNEKMPKHVAIILDGSRRWLRAQGKSLDYEPFFQANTTFADLCVKWGVGTATTFVHSLKNFQRGKEVNDLIFGQLEEYLEANVEYFIRKQISVLMIGEKRLLPKSLQVIIEETEEATRTENKHLEFRLAICYTGTRDIVDATRRLCEKAKTGLIEPNSIDEGLFEQELWGRAPHPDLLIRTGGRLRVSDYLMWQLAQTELYFTNIYAPEFSEAEFLKALRFFQQTERTFGK